MNERSSNNTTFHPLSIVLGIAISLGIAIPLALIPPDPLTAQQLKKKKPVPPPPAPPAKGFPGNRTVSASMSGNCDLRLVALAPEFSANNSDRTSERSIWGQTTAERPTFWFFVPATPASTQLEFSLQNRQGEDIYRAPLPTPPQPGVIGVAIPASQNALQLDRDYRWTLKAKVPCGTGTGTALNRVYVDGWVKRVSMGNKSATFVEEGIWYDAVNSLAQQRLQKPNDIQLQQEWNDLLESGNLDDIAKQPILK
jgi:hypothetical protein